MKSKTKARKAPVAAANTSSESDDEGRDRHEVEPALFRSSPSPTASSSSNSSKTRMTTDGYLGSGNGDASSSSSTPRSLQTQKSSPQLMSNIRNPHYNDAHRASSNETLFPHNYDHERRQTSTTSTTFPTLAPNRPYPFAPSYGALPPLNPSSPPSYLSHPSSQASISGANTLGCLFTPAGEVTPPIATSRSTTSLGSGKRKGGSVLAPHHSDQLLRPHPNGVRLLSTRNGVHGNATPTHPNHPPPPYEASIATPSSTPMSDIDGAASSTTGTVSPYREPSVSNAASRSGSFLQISPHLSVPNSPSNSRANSAIARQFAQPSAVPHTVRFDSHSNSSESGSESSESEDVGDLGTGYRGRGRAWGKRREGSAIYTSRPSMGSLSGGPEGASSSGVSQLSAGYASGLSARRSPAAAGVGNGDEDSFLQPPARTGTVHDRDQRGPSSMSASPNRQNRLKPTGTNGVNNSLRARILRFGLGLGWESGKDRKEREERMICTTPGMECAGETETETDEDSINLPTARIPSHRPFQHRPSSVASSQLAASDPQRSSLSQSHLAPPSSDSFSTPILNNFQDRFIPFVFEFSRWLSVVPAVCGVIYCLWWLWVGTGVDCYDGGVGYVELATGGSDRWRPPIPGRVDWFVAALWAFLTGYQCLSLSTGLLTRWRVYYAPLSTLVRLLALQGICWPATHLTLGVIGGDKRPVIAWAIIGTTTSVSKSVQIWVTSNLWWEGVEGDGENAGGEGEDGKMTANDGGQLRPLRGPSGHGLSHSRSNLSVSGLDNNVRAYAPPPPAWARWGGGGKWGGRRWDWKEVGVKCVLPVGILYFVTAWAEVLRREWEGVPGTARC